MKRILSILFALLLAFMFALPVFAEGESQPRVMITDYSVDGELKAGEKAKISVTLTNMSKTAAVRNMRIAFSEASGDLVPTGRSSGYVEALGCRKSCAWELEVIISENAKDGAHTVSVSCEYETVQGQAGTSTDSFTLNVAGKNQTAEPTNNNSKPYLMVTDYTIEGGSITPGEGRNVSVCIKNTNPSNAVSNIKLSLAEESGEIIPEGTGTAYVAKIEAGGTYTWSIALTAANTAKTGEHTVKLDMEYEGGSNSQFTASDIIRLPVRQSVKLDYSGAQLPAKTVQGETVTLSINLMNTGKSKLYNCMISCDIDSLESGGSVLVGEIPSGESKNGSLNLRVSSETLGEVSGVIKITYEDDFGETYEKTAELSTVIEEKVIKADTEEEEEKKNPLWWLFVLIGAIIGGALGYGIPYAIRSNKQRKEDEKRL